MNFGEVLSRAWEIIWKNKVLWIFGIMASLGGGRGGNGGGNNSGYRFNGRDVPMPGVERFFENIPPWVYVLIGLAVLVLFVVIILVSTLGRAGLLRGAWLADSGETGLTFSRLMQESRKYFVRVLLLGLLVFVIGITLFAVIFIPTILGAVLTMGVGLICLLPLLCLLVPVLIVLGVLVDLALVAIVGEDLGVVDGLRRSWEICRAHVGEIIVMAIILGIIGAVLGFLISLPLIVVAAPLLFGIISQSDNAIRGGIIAMLLLALLYLPILLVLSGIIKSYTDTAWTVTFRRLTGRSGGNTSAVNIYNAPVLEI